MRRQILPAVLMVVVLTVICGLAYPLVVTGVAQAAFPDKADGSFTTDASGNVVGSRLIGQGFTDPRYFWPRPSAAGTDGYDGLASGGSNLGPNDQTLLSDVEQRARDFREANDLSPEVPVPVDAVTASASGLDPHISVQNAELQARRVADARGLELGTVQDLVQKATEDPSFGLLGVKGVNVLRLNLLLDERQG